MGRPKLDTPRTRIVQVRLPIDLADELDAWRDEDARRLPVGSTASRTGVLVDALREGMAVVRARRDRKP